MNKLDPEIDKGEGKVMTWKTLVFPPKAKQLRSK